MKFREYLNEKLKDPEFKKLYEEEMKIMGVSIRLYQERERQKLTQKELAKKAGVTQQQLSKIEHGYNSNIMTYIKVAEALGLSVGVYK
ncbi:MAG: hypothetical protein A2068_12925 [Ignavibacteria bacterium GWB2_35_6b]|nr:MAG: hypothetical protein A2068_12925 [Ignavibacteria bacterium GWB2_35_6b]